MKKPNKTTKTTEPQATRVVFLLDRSGSMQSVKAETISGFNTYLDSLGKAQNMTVTAVQFDSQGIDKICDQSSPNRATRLTGESYQPRAWTPLYDAVGKTIRETRESVKKEKVLFVILTDGLENASSEFTSESVKKLMKEREDQDKWTFAFIGMGPGGWSAGAQMAAGLQSQSNVFNTDHTGAATTAAYSKLAGRTMSYAASARSGQSVVCNFWSQDKDE